VDNVYLWGQIPRLVYGRRVSSAFGISANLSFHLSFRIR